MMHQTLQPRLLLLLRPCVDDFLSDDAKTESRAFGWCRFGYKITNNKQTTKREEVNDRSEAATDSKRAQGQTYEIASVY